ncbi:unnamed protein product [Discula destructiva]
MGGRDGVDTADVASVAHRTILDGPERHAGQIYTLTGPQLLNMPERADIFSKAVGHKVRYLHLPALVFKRVVKLGGADAFMANGLVAQCVEITYDRVWRASRLVLVVERVTGKPATSFEKWAVSNRDKFEGVDNWPYLASGLAAGVAVASFVVWRKTTFTTA